ncbi:MAG: DUF2029 domain-containing protein [Alphaproteobacteria bacterium]|nr:DUF2029 domain-containing protein [Alphaproteobacteria bacterium]
MNGKPKALMAGQRQGQPILLAAAILLGFLTVQAGQFVDGGQRLEFAAASLAHGAIYLAAVVAVLRWPGGRCSLGVILLTAVALRLMSIGAPPYLSSDVFRYVWDGRLGWEGISPYLYVPADNELIRFRDTAIYPYINQKEHAVTIYPPVAQWTFMTGVAIQDGVAGMKAVMALFEAVTVVALIGWLRAEGLPASRVLIYAWHPLPIWEFSSQAHLDAAATALLALGIWAAVQKRQGLTGALFACAALIKYFPVVLLPALWRRWDWKLPAALVATMAALYLPYAGEAGSDVFGFLGQHLGNEGYKAGYGFHAVWLLRDFKIADPPGWLYIAFALAAIFAIALWAVFGRGKAEFRPERLTLLGAAFVFLTSPHYPWYFGFLCALAVRYPHPALLTMTVTSVVLYLNRVGGHTWTDLYGLVYVLPLVVWAVWEAAIRVYPAASRLNQLWLRPDMAQTKL